MVCHLPTGQGSPAPAYDRTASADHVVAAIVLIDTDNIEQVHAKAIRLVSSSCSSMLSASAWLFRHRWNGSPAGGHAPVPVVFQRFVLLAAVFDQIVKAFGPSGEAR